MMPGGVLVVSGPSGCGKSTLCRRLIKDPRVEFSVSATTRPMRKGEVDGRDYHFMDVARFRKHTSTFCFILRYPKVSTYIFADRARSGA